MNNLKNLDVKLKEYCKSQKISGVLRVTIKDKIEYQAAFGYANDQEKTEFSDNSMFTFYSMSKPFCAMGLLKLKDKGLVDLDEHPKKYVPEASGFDARVTIRHLLHHVSGLPDFEQNVEFCSRYKPGTADRIRKQLTLLTQYPSYFEPNSKSMYANVNFIIPALIIENVTGFEYSAYMEKEIFQPLGISTIYGVIADPLKNRLNGFNMAGLCLALAIVGLSFTAKNRSEEQTKTNSKKGATIFIFLCLAIFLFNGSALSVYSIFTANRANYNGLNFIFLYLFFCVLLCGIVLGVLFVLDKKQGKRFGVKECLSRKPLVCSLLYGTFFFGAEFCALTTTSLLPIVIQAPLSFAVNVVIVAIVDRLIYKQNLSKIQLLQIALAIICGVLFAL